MSDFFKEDKIDYMHSATRFVQNDDFFAFSIDENIERLYKQSQGDSAFYFLALLSFIEGFLRDKYKDENAGFDFDSGIRFDLTDMVNYVKNSQPHLGRAEIKTLHTIYNLFRTHSNKIGRKNPETGEYEISRPATDFYNTGDRIRHCFTKQTKENLQLMIQTFSDFSKHFDFYEPNKETIDKLLDDDAYFSEMKTRTPVDDDNLTEKVLQLLQLLRHGNSEERQAVSELLNQYQTQLALYARSWRDYQQMMSNLTDEQKSISDEILNHLKKGKKIEKLIKGGPGTGKTLILINLLQQTLDKNIKLLTYTNSLTKYNKFLANIVNFNGSPLSNSDKEILQSRIECFDSYFINLARQILKKNVAYLRDLNLPKITGICAKYGISKENFLHETNEIWLNLPKKQRFLDRTYAQATPVNKETQKSRENFWNATKELEKIFDDENTADYPLELFFFKMQDGSLTVPSELKSDYLLIDEIQDLEAAKIESIRKICKKGFILTGDLTQSVFVRKGLSWNYLNSSRIPLEEAIVTKNFRSTVPIQNLANKYREKITLKDETTIAEGFMPGPLPEAYYAKSEEAVYDKIVERIKFYKEALYFDDKDFCIIAANNDILNLLGSKLEKNVSIENEDFDFATTDDFIRLSRPKYVKGIDLPVIMLILDKNFLKKETNDNLDMYAQENAIYTCISRAMNIVNVFFIDDGDILKEPSDGKKANSVFKLFEVMKDSVISLD